MKFPADIAGVFDGLRLLGQAWRNVLGDFRPRAVEVMDGPHLAFFTMPAIETACRPECQDAADAFDLVELEKLFDVTGGRLGRTATYTNGDAELSGNRFTLPMTEL